MPSLQFDSPRDYDPATKQQLARELGQTYSRIMQAAVELVTVSIHDLGGGVWRCTNDEPVEAALIMCDVRSGRPAATRAELAAALIATAAKLGRLRPDQIKVEFTQHPGEDMYHPHLGGFNHDWNPAEG
jgi:phenylpyruvate tautomerase PptA (4-oxalocrotonate tautomerase family)